MKLMDFQMKLVSQTKLENCLNMPLLETMRFAIMNNRVEMADSMASAFKVPTKRFWRMKVRALADSENWEMLSVFSGKKSPIGYSPFVEACVVNHNMKDAAIYLEMMSDAQERLNCAMKWHLYEGAVKAATKLRDVDTLMKIIDVARSESIKSEAKQAIALIEGRWLVCSETQSTKRFVRKENGGEGHRSPYLSHAKRALYHLSYTPTFSGIHFLLMMPIDQVVHLRHYEGTTDCISSSRSRYRRSRKTYCGCCCCTKATRS